MTIHFGQGKLEAHERQAILEEVYQHAKAAATTAVKAVVEAMLEAEVTAKLGREKAAVRHISSQPRVIDWACAHCGCCDAEHFTRDGHYRRSLLTPMYNWLILVFGEPLGISLPHQFMPSRLSTIKRRVRAVAAGEQSQHDHTSLF